MNKYIKFIIVLTFILIFGIVGSNIYLILENRSDSSLISETSYVGSQNNNKDDNDGQVKSDNNTNDENLDNVSVSQDNDIQIVDSQEKKEDSSNYSSSDKNDNSVKSTVEYITLDGDTYQSFSNNGSDYDAIDSLNDTTDSDSGSTKNNTSSSSDSGTKNNAGSSSTNSKSSSSNSSNKNNTSSSSTNSNSSSSNSSNKNNASSSSNDIVKDVVVRDGEIVGATGYSALNGKRYLREKASNNSNGIVLLESGVPFRIISTNADDTWWKVLYNGKVGYVENAYCLINLPDYIPSITYDITNAYSSIYKSSGYNLSVTGKKLYKSGKVFNVRLGRNEYIVPVVYSFAKKILKVQETVLKDNYSLKIYDAYRPVDVANSVRDSLLLLYNSNSTVKKNIDYSYGASGTRYTWGKGWFIAQNLSAHSLGAAIDVTLVNNITKKELEMPSKMHELSVASIKYYKGFSSQTVIKSNWYAKTMNDNSKYLDKVMLNAGLNNLASEWWHFQDNTAYNTIKKYESSGLSFQPTTIVSIAIS